MRPAKVRRSAQAERTTEPAWTKWCRLCAKDDPESNVSVFFKNERNSYESALATAIGKYFWVNIKQNDKLPGVLCPECYTLINSLVQFTEHVTKVQTMFSVLQTGTTTDVELLREQFGLQEENFKHIIQLNEMADTKRSISTSDNSLQLSRTEDEPRGNQTHEEEEEFVTNETVTDGEEDAHEEAEEGPQEDDQEDTQEDTQEDAEEDYFVEDVDAEVAEEELLSETIYLEQIDSDEHYSHAEEEEANTEDVDNVRAEEQENIEEEVVESAQGKAREEHCGIELGLEGDSSDSEGGHSADKEYQCSMSPSSDSSPPAPQTKSKPIAIRPRRGRPPKLDDPELAHMYLNRSEEKEPTYACKLCAKVYKNPTSYRKHMKDGHDMEPDIPDFVCAKCGKTCPTARQLAAHERTHLPLYAKLDIPCPYCPKKFTKVSVMRQHVRGIHQNEKPYICDQCGRSCKTLANLNEHKLVHTNETPHECDVCQKRFKNKARLKAHYETHADSGCICTVCGQNLNTKRTLRMHMLVHSDEKQFQCNFCGASFKRTKALKNHLILHTGLKPYTCTFCDRTFSNGSNCRSHKKKVHPLELKREEELGKETKPVIVPKLEELRTCNNIIENPRQTKRSGGGLSMELRKLLMKAEEAKQRSSVPYTPIEVDLEVDEDGDDGMDVEEGEETVVYEIIDEI